MVADSPSAPPSPRWGEGAVLRFRARGASREGRGGQPQRPQKTAKREGHAACPQVAMNPPGFNALKPHAKPRRREGVTELFHAETPGTPRNQACLSRCWVLALPTSTALRPPAPGWPRDEDNPGFDPNAGANRIAVVVRPRSNSVSLVRVRILRPPFLRASSLDWSQAPVQAAHESRDCCCAALTRNHGSTPGGES